MSSPEVPAELLKSVVDYFNPRKVILFGSRARGDARPDSDHDLLVVIDDDFPSDKLHWRQSVRPRGQYRGPVDIVPMRHSVFEDRATIIGSLANTAEEEGVIVYDERKPPSDARQLEEAQRWFAVAAGDLLAVDLVLRPEPPLSNIEPAIAASLSAFDRITSWAAAARYPDGEAPPSAADVRTASEEVCRFVAGCKQAALSQERRDPTG